MLSSIPLIFTLLTSTSALALPRSASQILSDLRQVNADFVALAQADRAYGAGQTNATAVQARVTRADLDNDRVVLDATTTLSPLSDADADAIISYLSSTLEPSIRAAADATVANKAQIQAAGVGGLLVLEMRGLKQDNDNIGSAIGAKVSAGKRPALRKVIAKIDADYDYGIAQFS